MAKKRILIVDDEPAIRFAMRDFLEAHGLQIDEAETCAEAQEAFLNTRPDIVVMDYRLPDGNALDLLARCKEIDASVPLLVLTGHGSIDLAVRAIKDGAEQFLVKPIELPALLTMLRRLLDNQRHRQNAIIGMQRKTREIIDPFLGTSTAIRELKNQAQKILGTESPILIQGETGTGKGVLAAWLHQHGPRADEAMVDLNCAGLARDFLETELFGHEKGAFTGAIAAKVGLLETAQHGTVFLDEIGDIDAQVQPKVLKVLEEKRFRRLGDVRDRTVDIALIAATHQNLNQLVQEKKFRSDLYFRISTIPLRVPSLRERTEDIPELARYLLHRAAADIGRGERALRSDAAAALARYVWPGNVRELKNVLERAVLLSDRRVLTQSDFHFEQTPAADQPFSVDLTLGELERVHIVRVLEEERGRVEQAALRLGIPRSSLYQKIKKFGIVVAKVSD